MIIIKVSTEELYERTTIGQLKKGSMLVKTQHVLFIFDELTNGKKIRSREIIDQFGITPRTFARYISEINCYFFNFFKYKEVKYDRSEKVYYLTDL